MLVGIHAPHEAELRGYLRAEGFDVVCTRSRPAAIVYGNELGVDCVLCTPQTARVLSGCYPDGPLWVRHPEALGSLVVLRRSDADPKLAERVLIAMTAAQMAA